MEARLKIALVSPYDYAHPGGVVNHISHLYRQLTAMGHETKIITPCSDKGAFRGNGDMISLGTPFPVPSGGSIARPTLSPVLSRPARSILERERFDIVHLHEPLGSTLPLTILRVSQTVNVGTFHACHSEPTGYRIMKPFVAKWFRRLDGRIAVSKSARDFVGRHFPAEYAIIPNGVEVARFSAGAAPAGRFRDGRLNILFVGRMERRKGLRHLLNAYAEVKRELPGARLIVVGPGERRKHEKLVAKANLRDVVFEGYVSDSELPGYYDAADVFCAPATGEESFGIVLLEAMAAARPVVASNIDGYASVLRHGDEGLLVPPGDERALARAIIGLLKDRPRRMEMGSKGRIKAKEYDWRIIARRVADYYGSLLEVS